MSILGVGIQQPEEILDYDIFYDDWINIAIDQLTSVAINILPANSTLNVSAQLSGPDTVKLWVQGGNDGDEYTIEVTVTTTAGRVKQDELLITIQDFV